MSVHALPKVFFHRPNKPKQSPKRLIWLGILAAGLSLVVWAVFGSSFFRVGTITLSGTDVASATTYIKTLEGQNIFLLNKVGIESSLKEAYPPIATVTLVRGLPRTVRVNVTLREPKIVWSVGPIVYVLDQFGKVFDQGEKSEYAGLARVVDNSLLPLSHGQSVVSPLFIDFLESVRRQAKETANKAVVRFEVFDTTLLFDAILEGDIRVRFALERSVTEQMDNLLSILAVHPEAKLVDVRVGGWAYWN